LRFERKPFARMPPVHVCLASLSAPVLLLILIVAIVTPVLALALQRYLESRRWQRIEGARVAVLGSWEGIFRQHFLGKPTQVPIKFTFSGGPRRVTGHGHYELESRGRISLQVHGGFVSGGKLKVEYVNTDPQVLQCGTIFMELNGTGDVLEGFFAGFGLANSSPLDGSIRLQKVTGR
jgi:hypothetical protein